MGKLNSTLMFLSNQGNFSQKLNVHGTQKNRIKGTIWPVDNNPRYRTQQTIRTSAQFVPQNLQNSVTCFNCNNEGHLVKNCPYPAICHYCRESGHLKMNCPNRRKVFPNQMTRFRKVTDDEFSEPSTAEILGDSASQHAADESDMPQCAMVQNDWHVVNRRRKRKFSLKQSKIPDDIDQWSMFVNGDISHPPSIKEDQTTALNQKAKTVISQSNPEYAINKPVVACKVEGNPKNVFFDSGCESNVIDCEYAKRLGCKTLWRQNGRLKCANGSPLKILGYTVIELNIGSVSFQCKCTIVEHIFPNLIIGIKTQKQENIDISAARDCIIIKGNPVKFISTVTVPEN